MKVSDCCRWTGARPRPARHRHIGPADEVRDALAQGPEERQPGLRGRVGAGGGMSNPTRSLGFTRAPDLDICPVSDLPPGTMRPGRVGGPGDRVFNCDGTVYAMEDRCSHDDGPLVEGTLDRKAARLSALGTDPDLTSRRGKPRACPRTSR